MKKKLFILCALILCFSIIGCDSKSSGNELEFSIGDLLAERIIISGEPTVWIFGYKRFPAVILDDIEKDGLEYILVFKNGLTSEKTKVSVKKGSILDVEESIPLDMDLFGTYEAITKARGHIPTKLKVKNISKTKLIVEKLPQE